MPSRNVLRNFNLSTSNQSGLGGLSSANLLFWGDVSTFDTGSDIWVNKIPNGLSDAILVGSGSSSWERSGSAGHNMNGSNWIEFNETEFLSSSYVNDGYSITVTLSPSYQQITYSGDQVFQPMALWSPSLTKATGSLGPISYPQMYMNDVCPDGVGNDNPTRTMYILSPTNTNAWERNQNFYSSTNEGNLNFTFVFTDVDGDTNIDWYINGVYIRTGSDFFWGTSNTFMHYFGRTSSTTSGDVSAADDRNSNCDGVTINMPFTNFKGYIRDVLIYNRPLVATEVLQNYNALNVWSQLNN